MFIFIFAGKSSLRVALSAIYIAGTRLTFELARWPWQPVRFFENNSEIHDICWGIMNTYFLILWILPSGFGWNWCQNWRFILSTMCANDRNFRVSTRPLRTFLVLFVTTFEQKHRFIHCDWLKDHTWSCINTVHDPANNQNLSIFGTIFRNRYDCF